VATLPIVAGDPAQSNRAVALLHLSTLSKIRKVNEFEESPSHFVSPVSQLCKSPQRQWIKTQNSSSEIFAVRSHLAFEFTSKWYSCLPSRSNRRICLEDGYGMALLLVDLDIEPEMMSAGLQGVQFSRRFDQKSGKIYANQAVWQSQSVQQVSRESSNNGMSSPR
jgi:hypothetical protein